MAAGREGGAPLIVEERGGGPPLAVEGWRDPPLVEEGLAPALKADVVQPVLVR